MEFRTKLPTTSYPFQLNHQNNILCIGSCFAETIGNFLDDHKFNVTTNPVGTIFNPLAITNIINWGINEFNFDKSLVVTKEGRFTYFLFHSTVYAHSVVKLQALCKSIHLELHQKLHSIDTLIITLGTAYGYKHLATDTYVSNCHKVPQKEFRKDLLDVQVIESSLQGMISSLPNIQNTILTVSPVRHIKDTLTLNSVSKSTLRLVCHQLSTNTPNIHYFPSYELILDDLRDYRFYKEDMIHPTEQTRAYICEYFAQSVFSEETQKLNILIQKINSAVNHRPFNISSKEHQQFIQKTITDINKLPLALDFNHELETLSSQLI